MIRVIHYLPAINYTSGIANLVMNYYRLLDRNKIQFHFIYFLDLTEKNFDKEINKLGGTTLKLLTPTKPFKFKKELKKYIISLKEKYPNDTFIFQNHQISFNIFMYNTVKKCGIDHMIVHNHMTKFSDSKIKSLRNMLLFFFSKKNNINYFSCSKPACNLIMKYAHVKMSDIFIMNNAIDYKKFKFSLTDRNKIRNEYKVGDSILIGHIGHFLPVKNHKFILELFEKLYNINSNYKLLLIGNGALKDKYLNLINEKEFRDNIIVLSGRDDIPKLLCAMDLFVFPSKFEGLGIAAVEAEASGLPTFISSSVPSEVSINNCNIIPLSNMDEWVDKIINMKTDNRHNAYKMIENTQFDIYKNLNLLFDKYIDIINSNK